MEGESTPSYGQLQAPPVYGDAELVLPQCYYPPPPPQYVEQPMHMMQPPPPARFVVVAPMQPVVVHYEPMAGSNDNNKLSHQIEKVGDQVDRVSRTCCEGLNNLCSNCLFVVCWPFQWRPRLTDKGIWFALIVATLLMFLIAILTFELRVDPDRHYVSPWQLTSCQYTENIVTESRCCDVTNCQCATCSFGDPSCGASKSSLVAAPRCCNGEFCCNYGCDTCHRSETYSCNCKTVNKKYSCSTCTRSVPYKCNCRCRNNISNQLCSVSCGTCWSIQSVYGYNTTLPIVSTSSQQCGRDDVACKNNWIASHPVGNSVPCWWDNTNPNGGASFSYPKFKPDVAAIVFCIMSTIFMGLCFLGSCCFVRCRRHASSA